MPTKANPGDWIPGTHRGGLGKRIIGVEHDQPTPITASWAAIGDSGRRDAT